VYFKYIMIINDASRVVSEWCPNLEHHLRSSTIPLESSIMLLELPTMLLENIYSAHITHDNGHLRIILGS